MVFRVSHVGPSQFEVVLLFTVGVVTGCPAVTGLWLHQPPFTYWR